MTEQKWMVVVAETGEPFTTYLSGDKKGQPVLFDTEEEAGANGFAVVRCGFCEPGYVCVKQVEQDAPEQPAVNESQFCPECGAGIESEGEDYIVWRMPRGFPCECECKTCAERAQKRAQEFGRKAAEQMNKAMLDAISNQAKAKDDRMTEFGRVTKVVEPFIDEKHPGLVEVKIATADGIRQERFTKQQIDDMVREADRCRDAVIRLSPLDDVCTHVKALAAEVEQWQKDCLACERERARLAGLIERIHVYTMDYDQLGVDLARMKLFVIHRDTADKDKAAELMCISRKSMEELAALRLQYQQLRDACVYAYTLLRRTVNGTAPGDRSAALQVIGKLEYALDERCPTCGVIGRKEPYTGPRAEKGDFCPTCGILIRS